MSEIRCACGNVQGYVKPKGHHFHLVCYCKDCQAFANYLNQAETVLDSKGGTEIVQVAQSRLTFTNGLEYLAAIQLSEKGMVRWYTTCCHTPIGNILQNQKISFIGLIHPILKKNTIDHDFGHIQAQVNTQSATCDHKPQQFGMLKSLVGISQIIFKERISASYKNSPFFDKNGQLIVTPKILSEENK